MARKKAEKTIALEKAQKDVELLLSTLEPINYENGTLYVINNEQFKELIEIDNTISCFRTDTKRGKVFGIDSIIKIINPGNVANSFHLTTAYKSVLITDKGKIIDRLKYELTESEDKILKNAENYIKQYELDENAAKLTMANAYKKIAKEKDEYERIMKAPDEEEIIISTFVERIAYGQVNWTYFDKENKQRKTNAHLSSKKPSALILNEDLTSDAYRSDMKVARFIKESYRAFGNVFVKKKNK